MENSFTVSFREIHKKTNYIGNRLFSLLKEIEKEGQELSETSLISDKKTCKIVPESLPAEI